jgi:hypothetical protein
MAVNDYRLTVGALLSCRPWQLHRQTATARSTIANQHVTYPGLTRDQTVTVARHRLGDALFALSLQP